MDWLESESLSSWTVLAEGPKMDLEGVISCEDSMVVTNGRETRAPLSYNGVGVSVLQGDVIQATNACMLEITTRLRQHKQSHHGNHQSRYI